MGVTDGAVIGKTKILDNGSPALRWNLVLLSEGYRAAELPQFATDAQNFVNTLLATPPFSDSYLFRHLYNAINVYRVDVSSTASGADDPVACGGTGAAPATYFDARFCNSGVQRLLVVDNANALNVATTQVPQAHMVMVMVNSPIYGGSGGAVATFSKAASANEIALHEMGHTAFHLADEYEYWAGCGESGHDHHSTSEPAEPNVTVDSHRATIKWGDLILPSTPMPTTTNADCTQCDPQANPVAAGTVGAFEGAHYFHCGAFRPQFNCRMRALGFPFCAVCQREIRRVLEPHLPPIRIWDLIRFLGLFEYVREVPLKDWIADPSPMDLVRLLEAMRRTGVPEAQSAVDELSQLLGQVETMDMGQLRAMELRVKSGMARLESAAEMVRAQIDKRNRG